MKKMIFGIVVGMLLVAAGAWYMLDKQSVRVNDETSLSLLETPWQWKQTSFANGTKVVPTHPDVFILTFSGDGRLASSTDCNQLMGGYTTGEENTLSINNLASTRMACPGQSQESEYTRHLESAQTFTIVGDTLSVELRDSGMMVFSASGD